MNSTNKTVAKNASVLMISQVFSWGLTLLLMVFLPRILGAEGVGQLHLADSLWIIVGIFVSFGMDTYLTKEVARAPEKTGELLGISIFLRAVLMVIGFGGVIIYTKLVGYADVTITIIIIFGFVRIIGEFGSATTAVLVGVERMEFMALANIVTRAFSTFVTIAVLWLGYGVVVVAYVYVASSLVGFVVQLYFLHRIRPLRFSFSTPTAWTMLKASLPYVFITAFSVIYMNLDPIIISLLVNEETLGWYGSADRLLGTMMFIPVVFLTALFPALSRLNTESPEELRRLMKRSFDMLLLVGVPIGLGLFCVSNNLVVLLFGDEFEPSGPVLAIFSLALVFTYQNILINRFLVAIDKQNFWAIVMAVATFVTIPLDLLFIPWMDNIFSNGAIGGALSFVVTEVGMTIVGLRYLPEGVLGRKNIWVATRILLAGAAMTAVVWPLRHLFIAIPVIVGAVIYAALVLMLRVVSEEDKLLLKNQGLRIWGRIHDRRSKPAPVES